MTKKEKIVATQELKDLIHRCIILTDRRGRKISKGSCPVNSRLEMEYKEDGLHIWFYVTVSAMVGGHYEMKVEKNKKILLEANGSLTGFYIYPYDPKVPVYISGLWEKKIPQIKELER